MGKASFCYNNYKMFKILNNLQVPAAVPATAAAFRARIKQKYFLC
jgi:hypothetical protein